MEQMDDIAPNIEHNIEREVLKRYAEASLKTEAALCCPVSYDPKYLAAIPKEILARDYGCGDPSRYVREGEVVLDLGSGGGKICYIASQIVGPVGRVIGVDFNPAMLKLARKHRRSVAKRIGWTNVEFRRGRIQDLRTDLDALDRLLAEQPVKSIEDMEAAEAARRRMGLANPLIADGSIDIVISNCVLNLVRPEDKAQMFREMHRVLRRGGRVAISDIVSDEEVPPHLRDDSALWSGCVSGAYQEREFLRAFEAAGFHGIAVDKRDAEPWQTVEGIEFRSVTVTAYKGKEGPCLERNQAVIYKGPWSSVTDDDGHVLERGVPVAVCDKTFKIYTSEPYAADIVPVPPRNEVPIEAAGAFDCTRPSGRDPRETKGMEYRATTEPAAQCCPDSDCR
jgi:ubiquinone/menaquinone biosynthesis C-methylase UbiE